MKKVRDLLTGVVTVRYLNMEGNRMRIFEKEEDKKKEEMSGS